MPELILQDNIWDSYKHEDLSIHVAGQIVAANKALQGAKGLFDILPGRNDASDIQKVDWNGFMKALSGNFAVIIEGEGFLFAAVDISRTWPIFYSGESWVNLSIYDSLPINRSLTHRLNSQSVNEFFKLGFITGEETIFEGISQLQAGEYLCVDKESLTKDRFFTYTPSDTPADYSKPDVFVNQFDKLLMEKFTQLMDSFPGNNQWVVPLSGGHDSRLVVNCLKRIGVDNVVCFSYGTPGNKQSEISKRVAEAVGYKWYFIEYTEEKWKQLHDEGVIDAYIDYSFNGVSTPHFQDLLAVYELKNRSLIEDGAVFVPGHTSVSEVGFIKPDPVNREIDPIDSLMKVKELNVHPELSTRVYEKISVLNKIIGNQSHLLSENFDWQEKQAKYINNSVCVYRFFGYRFALPLWDKEVADFWLHLPCELSEGRKGLYIAEANGLLIDSLVNIPFANAMKKKKFSFKEFIKKLVPVKLINMMLMKSNYKQSNAEALNKVFALKGYTVGDVLSPIDHFPDEQRIHIKRYIHRRPYQVSVHRLARLYTLKMLFEQDKKRIQVLNTKV